MTVKRNNMIKQESAQTVSRLPMLTWKWLHMNDTTVAFERSDRRRYKYHPVRQVPAELTGLIQETEPGYYQESRLQYKRETVSGDPLAGKPGYTPAKQSAYILKETAELVEEGKNHELTITIPQGVKTTEAIVLEYLIDTNNPRLINRIHIKAGASSKAEVILRYSMLEGGQGEHLGYLTLDIEEGAEFTLVQAQMLSGQSRHTDAIQCEVAQDAKVRILLNELGAARSISGCDIRMEGDRGNADLSCLYIGRKEQERDLNYRISYEGKECVGRIQARGALNGKAVKRLKSTIDFKSGARGSIGREEESVLVLSDKVRNMSTPLLLCGEDDVEGQHATSIGRPDPARLYYLMSRGFSGQEARKLLVKAGFTPLLDKISDHSLRGEIVNYVDKAMEKEAEGGK